MTKKEIFNLNQETKLYKELSKIYGESFDELLIELVKIHNKYEKNGIITYNEMQKYDRFNSLLSQINGELTKIAKVTKAEIINNLTETYQFNYLYQSFLFEGLAGVAVATSLIPKKQVLAAIQNPIKNLTLSNRLEKNRKEIIRKTKKELTKGLIKGLSMKQMTKNIQSLYDNDINKAKRIVQTETTRNANAGTNESYKDAMRKGIEFEEIWVATLDKKTRKEHRKLDGVAKDEKGYWYIGNDKARYPGDFSKAENSINCRCSTIAQLKGIALTGRRVRNEGIGKYKTYEQWKNNLE